MTEGDSWRTSLWRGALLPSLLTALLSVLIGYLVRGSAGLAASLLASLTVIIFFSVHLIVARISRSLDPTSTMLVAMLSYFLKVALMAIFLILVTRLTEPESIDRPTFAVVALALTTAWLAGEIRAFLRLRTGLDSGQ
ncbi:MAG: hypothetical protein RL125_576 [Actinomycetota bacterium]